jgi:hypothetical protein
MLVGLFKWISEDGKPIIEKKPVIRFVLTWLEIGKVYTIPSAPSLEPIVSKFSGSNEDLSDMDLSEAINSLGINIQEVKDFFLAACENFSYHESSAAGPNGHALWASHLDGTALTLDPVLAQAFNDLANEMNIPGIFDLAQDSTMSAMSGMLLETDKSPIHSRLHVIWEKGVKSRIIAIGDYFSQALLNPFMVTLKNVLSNIPNDFTYNQEKGFNYVLDLTRQNIPCYSLDLSKATDRLPLKLQTRILGIILGNSVLAELWAKVMTARDFITPNGHKVKYAVGQPQGFKSSFHSMAFTHHVIVKLAALRAGLPNYSQYAILGDDIVLTDENVVARYKELMDILGVAISPEKSLIAAGDNSCAEFCKRIAFNGHELTGIPVHLLANTIIDPRYALSLWDHLGTRSIFEGLGLYEFFALFLNDLDLERMALYNVLPATVTGLKYRVILEESPTYSTNNFSNVFGFSLKDVESYYYYCLVSDQMAKVDGIIRKASSFLSIALESSKLGFGEEFGSNSLPLSVAIQDKLGQHDKDLDIQHPVQHAARNLGRKVVEILNAFSTDISKLPGMLRSGALNALCVSLDAQPQFGNVEHNVTGNRKIMDKALRLLEESVCDESKALRIFIGKVTGVTQAWSVSVGLGKGLLVNPHNSVVRSVSGTPVNRLRTLNTMRGSSLLKTKK